MFAIMTRPANREVLGMRITTWSSHRTARMATAVGGSGTTWRRTAMRTMSGHRTGLGDGLPQSISKTPSAIGCIRCRRYPMVTMSRLGSDCLRATEIRDSGHVSLSFVPNQNGLDRIDRSQIMPFLYAIGFLRLRYTTVIAFDGPVFLQHGSTEIDADRFRGAPHGKRQQSASTSITMITTIMESHCAQNE